MNAQDTVKRLLETPSDPDDPSTFVKHYQTAWQRAGFELEDVDFTSNDIAAQASADTEYQRYVWKEGIFSIEATQIGRGGEWEIYAYIRNTERPETQSAYARKEAKTEQRALSMAVQLRNELANSMAAKLVKLGFTGWRNHWHKSPINVTLKPSKHGGYANISVRLDYVPNEQAIKALTKLSKVADQILPIQNG